MFDIEDCKVTFLPEDTYEVSFPAGRMLLKYWCCVDFLFFIATY